MPGQIPIRTVLPIARHRSIYNAGIHLAHSLVVNAKALHHPGSVAFRDHISGLSQLIENVASLSSFQVKPHDTAIPYTRKGRYIRQSVLDQTAPALGVRLMNI